MCTQKTCVYDGSTIQSNGNTKNVLSIGLDKSTNTSIYSSKNGRREQEIKMFFFDLQQGTYFVKVFVKW